MAAREKKKEAPTKDQPSSDLRRYRKEFGLRKVELAKLAGVSEKTIQRLEKGTENFNEETRYKVLNALNKARRGEGMPPLRYEEVFPK